MQAKKKLNILLVILLALSGILAGCDHPEGQVQTDDTNAGVTRKVDSSWEHGPLECEGHKAKTDFSIPEETSVLVQTGTDSFGQINYGTSFGEVRLEVSYSEKLTTLYTRISKNKETVYFATLRVPTEDHNDSLADYSTHDGWRFYISCRSAKK